MKITLYFYHEQFTFESTGQIAPWHVKLGEDLVGPRLRIFLCEHEVEVPDVELLGDAEIKRILVKGLREQKVALQAETHIKLQEIDDKIQQLLCIEMKAEAGQGKS